MKRDTTNSNAQLLILGTYMRYSSYLRVWWNYGCKKWRWWWCIKKLIFMVYLGAHGKIEIENIISFNGPGPLVIRSWSDAHQKLIRCVLIFDYQIILSKLLVWCQMPSDSQISDAIWSTSDDQRTRSIISDDVHCPTSHGI